MAGVIGGTAAASLLGAQPQSSSCASAVMFDGFKISKVQTTGATINAIVGGQGPPVIAQLLGHAHNTQILPTYVKPLDENTQAVIEALDIARVSQFGKSPSTH